MENNNSRISELLKRAYEILSDSMDVHIGDDSWQSEELRKLMDEIADELKIEKKDRL